MTKSVKFHLEELESAYKAIDKFWQQFGQFGLNIDIETEKSYWQKYFNDFPEQKKYILAIYESYQYDNWNNKIPENRDIELDKRLTEIINFIK